MTFSIAQEIVLFCKNWFMSHVYLSCFDYQENYIFFLKLIQTHISVSQGSIRFEKNAKIKMLKTTQALEIPYPLSYCWYGHDDYYTTTSTTTTTTTTTSSSTTTTCFYLLLLTVHCQLLTLLLVQKLLALLSFQLQALLKNRAPFVKSPSKGIHIKIGRQLRT